jgi:hypothetical protein
MSKPSNEDKNRSVLCPCCGAACDIEKQRHLSQKLRCSWIGKTVNTSWAQWLADHRQERWACDECIDVRKVQVRDYAATCPGCGLERDLKQQKYLIDAVRSGWIDEPDGWFWMKWLEERPRENWACDACIKQGKAIVAEPKRQRTGMAMPYAAYIDRQFQCSDCAADFLFAAAEQQHWFETLGFLVFVHPKQCVTCRQKRRQRKQTQKAIEESLNNLDPHDPEQLHALARLYEEYGAMEKAAEIERRANNRGKRLSD